MRVLRPDSGFMRASACAAWHARAAWSGRRTGAFQIAKTASPMYLTSVPPDSNTCPVASEKYRLSIAAVSLAVIGSATEVNPAMSVNMAVATISSPPRLRASGSSATCFAASGERYSENARLTRSRSRTVVM